MTAPAKQDFWRAALCFYGKPGAVDALLTLQDQHQGDVMATLWVLTACSHGRLLNALDIAAYKNQTQSAAQQARVLRRTRRRLKTGPPAPYSAAKQAELAAERAIAAAAPDPALAGKAAEIPKATLAADNLSQLFQEARPPAALIKKLIKLINDA